MTLLIWLLLVQQSIFSHAVLCTDCESFEISLAGTPGISPMMKQWAFAYSLLRQNVGIEYTPMGGEPSYVTIMQKCRDNWLLDAAFSDVNYFLFNSYGGNYGSTEQAIPFFAGALVLPYNVPEIDGLKLYLTREVIHHIYTQEINNWNDARIQAIPENSPLRGKMPNAPIHLVLNQDAKNGPTVTIQTMVRNYDLNLSTSDPLRKDVIINGGWPMPLETFFKKGNWTPTKNDFSMVSHVLTNKYTLGYAPLSFVTQANIPYAIVANQADQWLPPDVKYLQEAIDDSVFGNKVTLKDLKNINVADVNGTNSYPLTAFYYIVFHRDVDQDCEMRRETWKFINWILTSDTALKQISATQGYAPFSKNFTELVLAQLRPVTCEGQRLLDYEYQEVDPGILTEIVIAIAAILCTITLVFILTLGYKRKNRITKAAGLAFALSFLIGCLLNYISIFFWAQVPDTDGNCKARYILVCLGYSLIFGSMFAKCWEIYKALAQAKTGDISSFQDIPWWKFCQSFAFAVGINVLLLLGLGSADPPRSLVHVTDTLNLYAMHVCGVGRSDIWFCVQFAYLAILVTWGGYLAYRTRDIWERYNYPNESRSILLSVYNVIFCIVVLVPLINALDSNNITVFFLTCVAIVFPTSFCLFTVCGTKVVTIFGSSFHASQHSQHTSLKKSHGAKENKAEKVNDSVDETRRRKNATKDTPKEEKNEEPRDLSDDDRPDDLLQQQQRRPTNATLRNTETLATKIATEIVFSQDGDAAWNVS